MARRARRVGIGAAAGLVAAGLVAIGLAAGLGLAGARAAGGQAAVLTGKAAYGDWRDDAPGVRRRITPADLPPPYASRSAARPPAIVPRPASARPKPPPGFHADLFAAGLDNPRRIRVAPDGDVFVVESGAGRVLVLRPAPDANKTARRAVFAKGLDLPFGIAFWPAGANPRFVYVAETGRVVRFPYRPGELHASGPAQTIVRGLPEGGHWTRDLVFSRDGSRMFVSVGSRSNDAESWLGGLLGRESGRAAVRVYTPEGKRGRVYASGLRNCSGEAVQPETGDLWCAVNERDGLGDNLPPDYATAVRAGGFYGWPWFYIGGHRDPRHKGEEAALRDRVVVPDVLIQPHSAPLGIAFYEGAMFPPGYRGDAFVALHGSWNRARRTGYKIVRLLFDGPRATGVYEDFMTGFVVDNGQVWGRPVALAVAKDGALLVGEDAGGTIWRVSYRAP